MNIHFRRSKRRVPMLNTAATADISFMLLIFFLVTSSMNTDKGLERMLPPIDDDSAAVTDVNAADVLSIELLADDNISVNGEKVEWESLKRRVASFIYAQAAPGDKLSAGATEHIISVKVDRSASYDAYFHMQNDIIAAYNVMRESRAKAVYGCRMGDCTPQQIEEIRAYYPQRIAEAYTLDEQPGDITGGTQ